MRQLIRVLQPIAAALALLAIFTTPVFAYLYRAQVSISENGTAAHVPMLPVSWNSSNTWMAANGFMRSDALDTRVQTLGGLNKPWMVTNNQTFTAVPVAANSQTNLYFVTGESVASDMDIIVGNGGYVTTTDNASLELSSNGTVGYAGYFNTGVTGNVWTKGNAASLSTLSSGRILFTTANVSGDNYTGSLDATASVWGANWYAQTFTPAASFNVSAAQLYTLRAGNPGNVAMSVRATAAGVPTGDNLTTGTTDGNAWSAGAPGWNQISFTAPLSLTAGTTYAVVFAAPSGDAANRIVWYYDNTAPAAAGQYCSSGDSGATWAGNAANDFLYSILVGLVVTASPGAYTTSASIFPTGVNRGLSFTVGSTTVNWTDTSATIAVPNTTDNWVWLSSTNASSYASNITLDNGVVRLHYDPNTIVQGNVLPNRAIASTDVGQITWGTNPTGVSVSMGNVVSSGQSVIGGATGTPTTNLLPGASSSDWNRDPDVSGALLTHPLRSLVVAIDQNTSFTERQIWVWSGIMFVAFVLVATAKTVRGHQGITAIAAGAAIVACVVQTIFPLAALVLAIPAIIFGFISERSPSL